MSDSRVMSDKQLFKELEAFLYGVDETCGWLEYDTKKYIVNGKEL